MSSVLDNLPLNPAFSGLAGITSIGIVLLGIGLALTVWLAFRRLGGAHVYRFTGVVLLNVIAAICIASWLFDIRWQSPDIVSATLLTQNSDEVAVPAYTVEGALYTLDRRAPADSDSTVLLNLYQLAAAEPDLQQLQIVGDGLSRAQWDRLTKTLGRPLSVTFVQAPPLLGLVDLHWSKRLVPGEYQQVSGKLQGDNLSVNERYSVSLLDPGGAVVAQQTLSQGQGFVFNFIPRTKGQWVYRLAMTELKGGEPDVGKPEVEESVAFEVLPRSMPRVLVVQSAPSFEARQVKRWLGQAGARVSLVTQISQDKHMTQHVNFLPNVPVTDHPIRQRTLHEIDLLIMDGRALTMLSRGDQGYVIQAVAAGMGLLVTIDASLATQLTVGGTVGGTAGGTFDGIDWLTGFSMTQTADNRAEYFGIPTWPNSDVEFPLPLWPDRLSASAGQSLVRGTDEEVLIAAENHGLGILALSRINTSYQWQLQGLAQGYGHFWQYLMARISRNDQLPRWYEPLVSTVDYVNQPIKACAQVPNGQPEMYATGENAPAISMLPTAQWLMPNQHCISAWPMTQGWYQFEIKTESLASKPRLARFIYGDSDWQAWRQADKRRATLAMAGQQKLAPVPVFRQVDPEMFWWLLVVASSLLWVERRHFNA
jgi:hypothetical protein